MSHYRAQHKVNGGEGDKCGRAQLKLVLCNIQHVNKVHYKIYFRDTCNIHIWNPNSL